MSRIKLGYVAIIVSTIQLFASIVLLCSDLNEFSKLDDIFLFLFVLSYCIYGGFSFLVGSMLVGFDNGPGFFVDDERKGYDLCAASIVILIVIFIITFIGMLFLTPWILSLINGLWVLTCVIVAITFCMMLSRRKKKCIEFIEDAIEANSTTEKRFTRDQARALFRLQAQKKIFEKFNGEGKRGPGESEEEINYRASQIYDFYLLSRWLNQLEKSKSENDSLSKLEDEIRERLKKYALRDKDRQKYAELAQHEDLITPPIKSKKVKIDWGLEKGQKV